MADASIIDIGGTQWSIKDGQARNDIETIKQLMTVETMPKIKITLNNGYSAAIAEIRDIQKYGKLYMGLIFINNLSGKNIGTNEVTFFGTINLNLKVTTYAVGIEFNNTVPVRISIGGNGYLNMMESAGTTDGNNSFRIPIIWIEA